VNNTAAQTAPQMLCSPCISTTYTLLHQQNNVTKQMTLVNITN